MTSADGVSPRDGAFPSESASRTARSSAAAPLNGRVAAWACFLGIVMLIGLEIGTFAALIVWSLGGLMGLSLVAMRVFAGLVAVPSVIAMVQVIRLAWAAEVAPAR